MDKHDPQRHETTSLSRLMHDFVREAEQAFPSLRGQLVLYNVRRHDYYVSQAFNAAARGFRSRSKFEHYIANHEVAAEARIKKDTIAAYAVREKKPRLSLIMFNEKVHNKEIKSLTAKRTQALLLTLDHELAHLAIKDAYNEENDRHGNLVEENVAEAYAQLMHYKRFGINGHYADGSGTLDLARAFVFQDSGLQTHFYYPAVRKIVACRTLINFDDLTAADIADLARRFAIKYTPSNAQMEDLNTAFKSCRKAYRSGGIPAGMRALAAVAETTPHPHVARISVDLFLDLSAQYATKLQGPQWDDIRLRINTLDAALAQDNVLYRIPKRTQAPMPPPGGASPPALPPPAP